MPPLPAPVRRERYPVAQIPSPPPGAFGEPIHKVNEELQRQLDKIEAEEEKQRLQTYDIALQGQIQEGIGRIREAAASETDPDKYKAIYDKGIADLQKQIQKTAGPDERRQNIANLRYQQGVNRELNRIINGKLARQADQSKVNAAKNEAIAVDNMAELTDPAARRERQIQYDIDVDQLAGLSAQEKNKLKQDFRVHVQAQEVIKRAKAGDALGAMKDLEAGAYKDLDLNSRKALRHEINSMLNDLHSIEARQKADDKASLESTIEAAIMDKRPAEEIKALIRQGIDQKLFGRTDATAYEQRVLGKEGKDTPEQISNFNAFMAKFQDQNWTGGRLAQARNEARQMWKSGELGNLSYSKIGEYLNRLTDTLDIRARRGEGGADTISKGAAIINKLYPKLSGDMLRRKVAPYMAEYNQRVIIGKESPAKVADEIYSRGSKEIQQRAAADKANAEAAAKAKAEKEKGGVSPEVLKSIQGLTQ